MGSDCDCNGGCTNCSDGNPPTCANGDTATCSSGTWVCSDGSTPNCCKCDCSTGFPECADGTPPVCDDGSAPTCVGGNCVCDDGTNPKHEPTTGFDCIDCNTGTAPGLVQLNMGGGFTNGILACCTPINNSMFIIGQIAGALACEWVAAFGEMGLVNCAYFWDLAFASVGGMPGLKLVLTTPGGVGADSVVWFAPLASPLNCKTGFAGLHLVYQPALSDSAECLGTPDDVVLSIP